jgi:KUP system potassium uptake protein
MLRTTEQGDDRRVQTASGTIAKSLRPAVAVAALGVVFGDIGTSPIYTIQTVFNPGDPHPVPVSDTHVYGIVSLIFWSVMTIVTLTYVTLAMLADNNGGRIMLYMYTASQARRPTARHGSPGQVRQADSTRRRRTAGPPGRGTGS